MSLLSYLARRLHLTPQYDPPLIVRNIAYFSGSDAHVNHKLDIFLPSSSASLLSPSNEQVPETKVPIIVHIHGGGWVHGSRTSESCGGPAVARTCAQEGFVGVVVSYRLGQFILASFLAWSLIFGLIIVIISLLLRCWQLVTGYIALVIIIYVYSFLSKESIPVNVEHVSLKENVIVNSACAKGRKHVLSFRWWMIYVMH
jgi:hypothetical protein